MDNKVTTWPDLAIGLYDKLTGRNAEITYEFKEMQVDIPESTASDKSATWKLNGSLTISTQENSKKGE